MSNYLQDLVTFSTTEITFVELVLLLGWTFPLGIIRRLVFLRDVFRSRLSSFQGEKEQSVMSVLPPDLFNIKRSFNQ